MVQKGDACTYLESSSDEVDMLLVWIGFDRDGLAQGEKVAMRRRCAIHFTTWEQVLVRGHGFQIDVIG